MRIVKFRLFGSLGSFRRPQSNNNHSTYHIIHKPALIGLICANVGIDKETMKENNLYPKLTNNIKYSISLNQPFNIKFWSEYAFNLSNVGQSNRPNHTPSKFERLVNPDYNVHILYDENDGDTSEIIENFITNIKDGLFVFPMCLGMANMNAEIEFIGEFPCDRNDGEFKTKGICTELLLENEQPFDKIRTDNIPTTSKTILSHATEDNKTIYFHEEGECINAVGEYYMVQDEAVEFI